MRSGRLVALFVLLTACGGPSLPPLHAEREIDRLYGDDLARMGLRVATAARYEEGHSSTAPSPSPTGTHFAICAEPAEPFTTARYVANIAPLTKLFADVLDRWPSLTSFDICQNPVQAASERVPNPVPVSHVRLSRRDAARVELEKLDLSAIIRGARGRPQVFAVYLSHAVRHHPVYKQAYRRATGG